MLAHWKPHGDTFTLLGVPFDRRLRMDAAAEDLVSAVTRKRLTILRLRRYHNEASIIHVYKAKVLSFCRMSHAGDVPRHGDNFR